MLIGIPTGAVGSSGVTTGAVGSSGVTTGAGVSNCPVEGSSLILKKINLYLIF